MYRITLQNTVLQSTPKETTWALSESSNRILISVTLLLYLRLLYTDSIGKNFLKRWSRGYVVISFLLLCDLTVRIEKDVLQGGGTGEEAPVLLTFPRDSHLVVVSK